MIHRTAVASLGLA